MLPINRKIFGIRSLLLLPVFAVLSSFSGSWGGDSYQVYVNNKLVLEQYVHGQKGVKTVALQPANKNDQVSIYYSHCGKTGQSRTLTLRDGKNKVLKEWTFQDAGVNGTKSGMTCKATEILEVKNTAGLDRLNLYYTSKEMPEGKLLVYLITAKDNIGTP